MKKINDKKRKMNLNLYTAATAKAHSVDRDQLAKSPTCGCQDQPNLNHAGGAE